MKRILIFVISAVVLLAVLGACNISTNNTTTDMASRKQLCREVLPEADLIAEVYPEGSFEGIVYEGTCDAKLVGYVVILVSKGYKSSITLMVGVDLDIRVTKVRILDQGETKGKGALIVEEGFLEQYIGVGQSSESHIDVISGATISCEAVSAGVENALTLVREIAPEKK